MTDNKLSAKNTILEFESNAESPGIVVPGSGRVRYLRPIVTNVERISFVVNTDSYPEKMAATRIAESLRHILQGRRIVRNQTSFQIYERTYGLVQKAVPQLDKGRYQKGINIRKRVEFLVLYPDSHPGEQPGKNIAPDDTFTYSPAKPSLKRTPASTFPAKPRVKLGLLFP